MYGGEREEAWGALLRRCDGRMTRGEEKKLDRALKSMSAHERAALRARLKRIDLLTKAWVHAERQARCAMAARALLGVMVPSAGAPVNLAPTFQFIMELNGLGTKKVPGVLTRKG